MRIITFNVEASLQGTLSAVAVNMLESASSIELTVTPSSSMGSDETGTCDLFITLPEEIVNKEGFSVWSVELRVDDDVYDTKVFEIDNTASRDTSHLETLIDRKSQVASIELHLARALVDAKTINISATEIYVVDKNDVILQKVQVIDGERNSAFDGYELSWINGKAELSIAAIMNEDGTWHKELTQEKEL